MTRGANVRKTFFAPSVDKRQQNKSNTILQNALWIAEASMHMPCTQRPNTSRFGQSCATYRTADYCALAKFSATWRHTKGTPTMAKQRHLNVRLLKCAQLFFVVIFCFVFFFICVHSACVYVVLLLYSISSSP